MLYMCMQPGSIFQNAGFSSLTKKYRGWLSWTKQGGVGWEMFESLKRLTRLISFISNFYTYA